jgi:hypothetical protein
MAKFNLAQRKTHITARKPRLKAKALAPAATRFRCSSAQPFVEQPPQNDRRNAAHCTDPQSRLHKQHPDMMKLQLSSPLINVLRKRLDYGTKKFYRLTIRDGGMTPGG